MREGWCNEEYWLLCEDREEAELLTTMYGLADHLPSYLIIGLKGWDDFILTNGEDQYFLVRTVPLERGSLAPFSFSVRSRREREYGVGDPRRARAGSEMVEQILLRHFRERERLVRTPQWRSLSLDGRLTIRSGE